MIFSVKVTAESAQCLLQTSRKYSEDICSEAADSELPYEDVPPVQFYTRPAAYAYSINLGIGLEFFKFEILGQIFVDLDLCIGKK